MVEHDRRAEKDAIVAGLQAGASDDGRIHVGSDGDEATHRGRVDDSRRREKRSVRVDEHDSERNQQVHHRRARYAEPERLQDRSAARGRVRFLRHSLRNEENAAEQLRAEVQAVLRAESARVRGQVQKERHRDRARAAREQVRHSGTPFPRFPR